MATELKLQIHEQSDGALKVSWNDIEELTKHPPKKEMCIFGGLLVFCIFSMIQDPTKYVESESLSFFISGVAVLGGLSSIIWVLSLRHRRISLPNEVLISRRLLTHKGRDIEMKKITRFDYGKKDELTGSKGDDNNHLIRVWVEDSYCEILAENLWDSSINHQIRDALDKAWREVKGGSESAEHEAKYGKVTDDGIPDYD